MISFVVILLCCTVTMGIISYEYFKKKAFIAKVVDGQNIPSNFISPEAEKLITYIKDKTGHRVDNRVYSITFSDGQSISYAVVNLDTFKKYSNLAFTPTEVEWEIFRLLVKKVYNLS